MNLERSCFENRIKSYLFCTEYYCYYEKNGSAIKNITDEIPFDIPENWSWCRLPEIGVSELGKTLNKEKDVGETVPYLCSINVYWDKISLAKIKIANFSVNDIKKYRLQKGDLLMCEGGEAGRCFVWEFDKEMYYQNALHRIRFYDKITPLFFKYVFETYYAIGIIDNYCKGVTIKHLVQGALHSILLPLPPIKEQQRIICKIKEVFSKIKDEV